MKTYTINECFYSLQGEGARAGTANVFLRFSGCNLQCSESVEGFNCDTDFRFGEKYTLGEIVDLVLKTDEGGCRWIICTGGEPTLQLDEPLSNCLRALGYRIAVETNGTLRPEHADPMRLCDWITVSSKRGHPVKLRRVNEVRVVLSAGEEVERQVEEISADHYYVSPAFSSPSSTDQDEYRVQLGKAWQGDSSTLVKENLEHCINWCLKHPKWKLSIQQHKVWGVR